MTKITVEQAVAAIQAADTQDAIKAVLEQCTKAQLHEVFLTVTNNKDELQAKSSLKGELVDFYSATREAFKKMDAEAKAEYLISGKYEADYNQLNVLLHQSSLYELLVIAVKFGADFEQFTAEYQLHRHYSNVFRELFTSVLTLDSARRTAEWEAKREALKAAAEKQEVPAVIETPTSEPITKNIQSETAGISVELKETEVEVPAIDSYEIGKRIVSLKGNAKAQQTVVQECGEEFLRNMYFVFHFAAPIRITMETPDELREYLCRDVIRVVRDAKYARLLLNDVQHRLDARFDFDNPSYLEGWAKFLEDYASPKKALTVEERLDYLKQCIREVLDSRAFHRHTLRVMKGSEFEERFAKNVKKYTAEIRYLIGKCRELKQQMNKSTAVSLDQSEALAVVEETTPSSELAHLKCNHLGSPAAVKAESIEPISEPAPVKAVTYADVEEAYRKFEYEETKCCTAGSDGDFSLCDKLEREYLRLLADYAQTDMPESKEVLEFIRSSYQKDYQLADNPFLDLGEMAMKCGINGHSYRSRRELARDLCRVAGLTVLSDYSSWELYKMRKQLQEVLHDRWQIRHAMRRLKKLHQAGVIDDKDFHAMYSACNDKFHTAEVFFSLLEDYKETCRAYAEANRREMRAAG